MQLSLAFGITIHYFNQNEDSKRIGVIDNSESIEEGSVQNLFQSQDFLPDRNISPGIRIGVSSSLFFYI